MRGLEGTEAGGGTRVPQERMLVEASALARHAGRVAMMQADLALVRELRQQFGDADVFRPDIRP